MPVVVGFLVLFSISYDIASPLIVGYIEELVVGDFELKSLYVSVAVYAGVLVFSMASTYLQAVILQRVGQRIISDLREDLFTHIESLSHGQLNDIPVGKLVTRVTNDTNAISMMFTNLFVNLTKNAFVILGILVAMLFLNYELTLMVLCFVPFILLFTVIFRKFSRRAYRKVKDATTDINTYLSENLSGIKVTQIFGREDEKMEEFRQKSQTLAKATQEQIFVFGVFRPLVYMLYISSILCLFYLGGMGHLNHVTFLGQTISSGTIVTFYMYISKFFTPIQNLAEQFNWLQSALASSEKVFSIMDIQPQMVDAPDAVELDEVKGDIEFRDVWFSYIPGEWVLQGVSFHVNPRQTVAFVGSTGSGKSFAAKREIISVLLNDPNADVLIIDPEREYTALAHGFDGEVIHISADSPCHLNPMDLSDNYADDDNPISLKSDFIMSICDLLSGGLQRGQNSIIDRVIRLSYEKHFNKNSNSVPTLNDFYDILIEQPDPEARSLALSLELYIKGNLSVFAHHTNVDTTKRFVIYDIRDLGKQLRTLGMLIVLDQIWNRITENRALGKHTYIYIDEIQLLFSNEYASNYFFELWSRSRKWGAVPTGITQNVETLLLSDEARRMLSNCDYIMMLNQATSDKLELAQLLSISERQLNYVSNVEAGSGLLFAGKSIIPFVDKFPRDTELYKMITTKLEEVTSFQSRALENGKSK